MMDTTVIAAVIAAGASLMSATIAAMGARDRARQQEREELREQLNVSQTSLLLALVEAQDVALRALDHEHLNGEVKAARESLAHARDGYQTARSRAVDRWM